MRVIPASILAGAITAAFVGLSLAVASAAPPSPGAPAIVSRAPASVAGQSAEASIQAIIRSADAAVALGSRCEEADCPVVDCAAIAAAQGRILDTIQVLRLSLHYIDEYALPAEIDGFYRRDLEVARDLGQEAIDRLVEALAALSSCASGLCQLDATWNDNVVIVAPRVDEWLGTFERLLNTRLSLLRDAISAIEVLDECPPGGGAIGVPLRPEDVCPECAELAFAFEEAELRYRRLLVAYATRSVDARLLLAAHTARRRARAALLNCLDLWCPAQLPPRDGWQPPDEWPWFRVSTACPRCEYWLELIYDWQVRRAERLELLATARRARDSADDPANQQYLDDQVTEWEISVREAEETISAHLESLQHCESVCSAGTVLDADENELFFTLLFADDDVFFEPASVQDVLPGPEGPVEDDPEPDPVFDPIADLSITKSDSADPVTSDEVFTYRIAVDNAGPDFAHGVEVVDQLPDGILFGGVDTTLGECDSQPGGLRCSILELPPGHRAVITITAQPLLGSEGELVNTATVSADERDPDDSNNSATETTTVIAPPDDPLPLPAMCPLGIEPGSYDGNDGLGIGMAAVSCPDPSTLVIEGSVTIVCDATGFCGANNVIRGIGGHIVNAAKEAVGRFRLDAERRDADGNVIARGQEVFTLFELSAAGFPASRPAEPLFDWRVSGPGSALPSRGQPTNAAERNPQ